MELATVKALRQLGATPSVVRQGPLADTFLIEGSAEVLQKAALLLEATGYSDATVSVCGKVPEEFGSVLVSEPKIPGYSPGFIANPAKREEAVAVIARLCAMQFMQLT